jgi:Bucentaur or craniofacial development
MNAPGTASGLLQSQNPLVAEEPDHEQSPSEQEKENIIQGEVAAQGKLPSEDMIKIKRTYKFAGEIHTEEKMVPRDSAEAKLYLAETTGEKPEDLAEGLHSETTIIKLRRPLRKVSRFDPNPTGVIKKSWEKQAARAVSGDVDDLKGPKLNTVEKSRLDWAQYVDETGIKDELNVHSKAKEGYMGRMDFLNRVDANREDERRNIRLKGL